MPGTAIRREQRVTQRTSTEEAGNFVSALRENVINQQSGTFDSAANDDFLSSAINQNTTKVPETLQALFDEVPKEKSNLISRAILDGVGIYETEHGCSVPDDIIELAFHMAFATTDYARQKYLLDSASNAHSDQLSLQPNRAVVSIIALLAEAIPFANYLPADIGSNEARLAILSHQTGSAYGMYAQNALLNGAAGGDTYLSPSRRHKTTTSGGAIPSGALTTVQTDRNTCNSGAAAITLLRGRTQVYIGGQIVATEVVNNQGGSGNSTISGTWTLNGTSYAIAGVINTDTGVYSFSSTGLPNGYDVIVEGFIDYERTPSLTPSIITVADSFKLYAKPWRGYTQASPDAISQMSNELGIDPYSESIIAIQNQIAIERHYEVLNKALLLANNPANVATTYDFNWTVMGQQKLRWQIMQDIQAEISQVSQRMAENTLSYGVTHLYVGKYLKGIFESLPSELFVSSGITARPGIYRIGRLFGLYEVYYTPKIVTDTASAAQMLCIGRSQDSARNPFVLGDAVPPSITPLGIGTDLKRGAGFYARNFTEVNPHAPSSLGCALISVTNTGL